MAGPLPTCTIGPVTGNPTPATDEDRQDHEARPRRRRTTRWTLIAIAAVIAAAARPVALPAFDILSGSMTPTVRTGDRVIVDALGWRMTGLHRGDVVVFDGTGNFDQDGTSHHYVKRVIATGGDVVSCCTATGAVTVNGTPLHEPYLGSTDGVAFGPALVPTGHVYVLGDNRADSDDSRYRGPVPVSAVIGRAFAVTLPATHLSLLRSENPLKP